MTATHAGDSGIYVFTFATAFPGGVLPTVVATVDGAATFVDAVAKVVSVGNTGFVVRVSDGAGAALTDANIIGVHTIAIGSR